MISYSVSNQGTPQIVLNRYIYGYHYSKNAGASVWRCASSRSRCCARVILDNGKVLKRAHAHNHPYHDAQILKRVKKRNIYTTIRDAEEAIHTKKRQEDDNAKIEKVAVTSLDE